MYVITVSLTRSCQVHSLMHRTKGLVAPADSASVGISELEQRKARPLGLQYLTPAQIALMLPVTIGIICEIVAHNIKLEPSEAQPHLAQAIKLSEAMNLRWALIDVLLAFFPLLFWHVMLHAKAVARAIESELKKQQRANEDVWEVQASAAIRFSTMGALLLHFSLWIAFLYIMYGFELAMRSASYETTPVDVFYMSIIAIISVWLFPVIMRTLAVGTVRRERANTGAYVERLQRLILAVLFAQVVGLTVFIFQMASTPLSLAHIDEQMPDRGRCRRDVNASYVAAHCTIRPAADTKLIYEHGGFMTGISIRDAALAYTRHVQQGGEFVCTEPSTLPFRSLFDACRMRDASYIAKRYAMDWLGVSIMFMCFMIAHVSIPGLDARVTWANIYSRGSFSLKIAACCINLNAFVAVLQALDGLTSLLGPGIDPDYVLAPTFLFAGPALVLLCVEFLAKRFRSLHELTPPQKKELQASKAALAAEESRGVRSFWFVSAKFLRECNAAGLRHNTLPRMQELRKRHKELGLWDECPLRRIEISRAEAYSQSSLVQTHLIISHRWLEPSSPDVGGEQLRKIQDHLKEHPEIEWVWYDCKRSRPGKAPLIAFDPMALVLLLVLMRHMRACALHLLIRLMCVCVLRLEHAAERFPFLRRGGAHPRRGRGVPRDARGITRSVAQTRGRATHSLRSSLPACPLLASRMPSRLLSDFPDV